MSTVPIHLSKHAAPHVHPIISWVNFLFHASECLVSVPVRLITADRQLPSFCPTFIPCPARLTVFLFSPLVLVERLELGLCCFCFCLCRCWPFGRLITAVFRAGQPSDHFFVTFPEPSWMERFFCDWVCGGGGGGGVWLGWRGGDVP